MRVTRRSVLVSASVRVLLAGCIAPQITPSNLAGEYRRLGHWSPGGTTKNYVTAKTRQKDAKGQRPEIGGQEGRGRTSESDEWWVIREGETI